MVLQKWNWISCLVSALVSLDASMKFVHLHLTMVCYRACQWRKYLRETDVLKIKAFLKKNPTKQPKNASKKDGYWPQQERIREETPFPVRYSHRTLGNPESRQCQPADWASCGKWMSPLWVCSNIPLTFLREKWWQK